MKKAVSNLLHGLPIQGYYSMNISGISEVGKLVGDVEIVVPDDSLEEHDPYFKEGATVIINGDNAEEFLRYRDTGKSQSALVRQQRQKTYLKALIPKLQEKMQTNSSFVGSLLDDIQPYTVTNMGNDVFVKLLNFRVNRCVFFCNFKLVAIWYLIAVYFAILINTSCCHCSHC